MKCDEQDEMILCGECLKMLNDQILLLGAPDRMLSLKIFFHVDSQTGGNLSDMS